ncbi:unnamed protein product [Peniophora sp. CBMAI 1063]|nr:unnamed protein product [Peniophora sp. CBMAI 1063]
MSDVLPRSQKDASTAGGYVASEVGQQSRHGGTAPVVHTFQTAWESFVGSLLEEWKSITVVSALLSASILALLALDGALDDPVTRTAGLASLLCSLWSIVYSSMYIVRFSQMQRRLRRAVNWAREARKAGTNTIWNVWVLLAMPLIWLMWSLIAFMVSAMSFVWFSASSTSSQSGVTSAGVTLGTRIFICFVLGLGFLYLLAILNSLRHYGREMDRVGGAMNPKSLEEASESDSVRSTLIIPHGATGVSPIVRDYLQRTLPYYGQTPKVESTGTAYYVPFSPPLGTYYVARSPHHREAHPLPGILRNSAYPVRRRPHTGEPLTVAFSESDEPIIPSSPVTEVASERSVMVPDNIFDAFPVITLDDADINREHPRPPQLRNVRSDVVWKRFVEDVRTAWSTGFCWDSNSSWASLNLSPSEAVFEICRAWGKRTFEAHGVRPYLCEEWWEDGSTSLCVYVTMSPLGQDWTHSFCTLRDGVRMVVVRATPSRGEVLHEYLTIRRAEDSRLIYGSQFHEPTGLVAGDVTSKTATSRLPSPPRTPHASTPEPELPALPPLFDDNTGMGRSTPGHMAITQESTEARDDLGDPQADPPSSRDGALSLSREQAPTSESFNAFRAIQLNESDGTRVAFPAQLRNVISVPVWDAFVEAIHSSWKTGAFWESSAHNRRPMSLGPAEATFEMCCRWAAETFQNKGVQPLLCEEWLTSGMRSLSIYVSRIGEDWASVFGSLGEDVRMVMIWTQPIPEEGPHTLVMINRNPDTTETSIGFAYENRRSFRYGRARYNPERMTLLPYQTDAQYSSNALMLRFSGSISSTYPHPHDEARVRFSTKRDVAEGHSSEGRGATASEPPLAEAIVIRAPGVNSLSQTLASAPTTHSLGSLNMQTPEAAVSGHDVGPARDLASRVDSSPPGASMTVVGRSDLCQPHSGKGAPLDGMDVVPPVWRLVDDRDNPTPPSRPHADDGVPSTTMTVPEDVDGSSSSTRHLANEHTPWKRRSTSPSIAPMVTTRPPGIVSSPGQVTSQPSMSLASHWRLVDDRDDDESTT